jgi:hypothetical protein
MNTVRLAGTSLLVAGSFALGQSGGGAELGVAREAGAGSPVGSIEPAAAAATAFLVGSQEGESGGEWPYEGVYRVRRQIPIGYRVGGTGICAMAVLGSPGFAEDAPAREAVERARGFVIAGIEHPLMSEEKYDAGYDVRGWGYTYGAWFLLECKRAGFVPEDAAPMERAIEWYVSAIQKTEIPKAGGWNYARPPGRENVAPMSPFMTAPTLLVLFQAAAMGYEVDGEVVKRGLEALERGRTAAGGFAYAGDGARSRDGVPGATGRMLSGETALYLAGRSSQSNLRGALDAFLVHWDELEKRRAKTGTHEGPYGVAPYYFYFAHYWAAQAAELLPAGERAEYRRRVREVLLGTRSEEGTWNDRVFPRSASYGTAMASMALRMPEREKPQGWPVTGR